MEKYKAHKNVLNYSNKVFVFHYLPLGKLNTAHLRLLLASAVVLLQRLDAVLQAPQRLYSPLPLPHTPRLLRPTLGRRHLLPGAAGHV